MSEVKRKKVLLNLMGEIPSKIESAFAAQGITILTTNDLGDNKPDLILVGNYDKSFSTIDSAYSTISNNIPIISVDDVKKKKDFLLSNGKVIIDPYWVSNPLGSTIFNRMFANQFSIHLDESFGQNLKSYKTQKIANHLRSGLYSDIITTEAFINDYEAVGIRGFTHNIIYYFAYLQKFGSGIFPIEMQYAHSGSGFAIQFHASVSNFSSEYIFDCFGIGTSREPVQYLLGYAHQLCPLMDILYIEDAGKLLITGIWPKIEEQKEIKFNSLSINRINSISQILKTLNIEFETAQTVEIAAIRNNEQVNHVLPGQLLESIIDTPESSILKNGVEKVNSIVNYALKNLSNKLPNKPISALTTDDINTLLADHSDKETLDKLSDQDRAQIIERMINPNLASAIDQAIGRYEDLMVTDENTQNEFAEIIEEAIMEDVESLNEQDEFLARDREGADLNQDSHRVMGRIDLDQEKHHVDGNKDEKDQMQIITGDNGDQDNSINRVKGKIEEDDSGYIVKGTGENLSDTIHRVKGKVEEDNFKGIIHGSLEDFTQDVNRIKGKINNINLKRLKPESDDSNFNKDYNRMQAMLNELNSDNPNIESFNDFNTSINSITNYLGDDQDSLIIKGQLENITEEINIIRGKVETAQNEKTIIKGQNQIESGFNINNKISQKEIANHVQKTILSQIKSNEGKNNFDFTNLKETLKGELKNKIGSNVPDKNIDSMVNKSVEKARKLLLKKSMETPQNNERSNINSLTDTASLKETALLKKALIAEKENQKLKDQIAKLRNEIQEAKSVQSRIDNVDQNTKQTLEKVQSNIEKVIEKEIPITITKEKEKELSEKINVSSTLNDQNKDDLFHLMEKEKDVNERAKNIEIELKKMQIAMSEQENGYKRELEQQEKIIKGKDHIISKAKENIKTLISKKQEEINLLSSELGKVREDLKQEISKDHGGNIQQLEKDNSDLKQQLLSFRKKVSILSEKINESKGQTDDDKMRQLSETVKRSTQKQKSLEDSLKKANDRIKTLTGDLAISKSIDLGEDTSLSSDSVDKTTEMQLNLRKSETEKKIIQGNLENSQNEVKRLTTVIANLNKHIKMIAEETGKKEYALAKEVQDASNLLADAEQAKRAEGRSSMSTTDNSPKIDLKSIGEIAQLQKDKSVLENQLANFQTKIADLTKKLAEQKEKTAAASKAETKQDLNATGSQKEIEFKLKQELTKSEKEINELTKKLEAAKAIASGDVTVDEASIERIAELESEIKKSDMENSKMSNDLIKASTEIKGLNSIIASLQQHVENVAKETGDPKHMAKLEEVGSSLRLSELERKSLTKTLDRSQSQIDKLQEKIREQNKIIADLNKPKEDDELHLAKRELIVNKSKLIETENKLKIAEKQTWTYQNKLKEMDIKIKEMKDEKTKITKSTAGTEQLDPKIKQKIDILEKGKNKLMLDLKALQDQAAEQKKIAAQYKAKNTGLQNQLKAMERELLKYKPKDEKKAA